MKGISDASRNIRKYERNDNVFVENNLSTKRTEDIVEKCSSVKQWSRTSISGK